LKFSSRRTTATARKWSLRLRATRTSLGLRRSRACASFYRLFQRRRRREAGARDAGEEEKAEQRFHRNTCSWVRELVREALRRGAAVAIVVDPISSEPTRDAAAGDAAAHTGEVGELISVRGYSLRGAAGFRKAVPPLRRRRSGERAQDVQVPKLRSHLGPRQGGGGEPGAAVLEGAAQGGVPRRRSAAPGRRNASVAEKAHWLPAALAPRSRGGGGPPSRPVPRRGPARGPNRDG
jgi:hypothetical protein